MTAQISDTFRYRKKARSLAGLNGSGLFDPAQYGITPVMISTACWRGFNCTYEVQDGGLFLTQVHLGLSEEDQAKAARGDGPKLFGKIPKQHMVRRRPRDFMVDDIREPVPFTGGLLLGDDFIMDLYVHMGFHPAYKFRVVHELLFDSGRLTEENDRSARMAEYREIIASKPQELGNEASRAEIEQWVEQCFNFDYTGFGGA